MVKFKGEIEVKLGGAQPEVGQQAPDFKAVKNDLSEVRLSDYKGKRVVLNVFPSVDTGVCAASVRRFNKAAASLKNTVVLCISMDLPFAQQRFCAAEGIENVVMLSAFRCTCFSDRYGLRMESGPLEGLLARSVFVIDEDGKLLYKQVVPEVTEEPNYKAALDNLK